MEEQLPTYQELLQPKEEHTTKNEKKNNNKIFLLISIICSILVLAFIVIFLQKAIKNNTSTNHGILQSNKPLPKITTVILTDTGFSPQDITIGKGTAVQWINTSTDNASVNSDDYPTNRLYPELNLGKFSKGSTLVHIFNTPGTYSYHNQFNPKQTGTVIVE